MKLEKNYSYEHATAEVLVNLASSSTRAWQRTSTLSNNLRPGIGRLRMRRCGPTPALTIFFAYAPTSSYEKQEVEAFYMDLKKFYREDHAFYKVIIGDFNAKVGPKRTPEELHTTHGLQWNE